jgi:hypothetical protein
VSHQADISCVEPPNNSIKTKQLCVRDERWPHIIDGQLCLQPPEMPHLLDYVAPVQLDDLVYVNPWYPHAYQHLNEEFISWRGDLAWRRPDPRVQFACARRGDHEPLPGPAALLVLGGHQPGTLKALQGDVHLTRVQRPYLAGLVPLSVAENGRSRRFREATVPLRGYDFKLLLSG